ncbi:MAG: hypothetical protein B6D36_12600 [Planctomycetes bacterium UTPLA1]|nr:MAG: hypothetical protein B6D36_12600 [Planctomycetes bacterium UTPLA1]
MSFRAVFALSGMLLCVNAGANAQSSQETFPAKSPIRLVVPYATGGQTDALGRLVAKQLAENLKQPIVVENKTGAGGMIGTKSVADASPDGYTLLMAPSSALCTGPLLFQQPKVDPLGGFVHIAPITTNPFFLLVNASSGVTSLQGLLNKGKESSQGLNYGSAGNGTPHHLAMEMLRQQTGVPLVHVPYQGSQAAIIDLLGGRLDVMVSELTPAIAHIQAGRLRPLAVLSPQRSALLPEVPAVGEAGVPNMDMVMYGWSVISAPKGLPPRIAEELNNALALIVRGDPLKKFCTSVGCEPASPKSVGETRAFVEAQVHRCERVIREVGIKPQ